MAAAADRVTAETNAEYQRINTADVYRNMVTDQVNAEWSTMARSDAFQEIYGDEHIEYMRDALNEATSLGALDAELRQDLINIRVERGE